MGKKQMDLPRKKVTFHGGGGHSLILSSEKNWGKANKRGGACRKGVRPAIGRKKAKALADQKKKRKTRKGTFYLKKNLSKL